MEKSNIKEGRGKNVYLDDQFFNIYAMEKLIKQNSFIGKKYQETLVDEEKYGYHKNENILNELFRLYVLPKNINPAALSYEQVINNDNHKELSGDDNYPRFKEYMNLRQKVERFKNKKSKKIDETTTAASSGAYVGKSFLSPNKNKSTMPKAISRGYTSIVVNPETHDSGVDSFKYVKEGTQTINKKQNETMENNKPYSIYETILGEETQHPALARLKRVQSDNPKNFKDAIKHQSDAIAKEVMKKSQDEVSIQHVRPDNDSISPKDIVKVNNTDEQDEEVNLARRGVEDIQPDTISADEYIEKIRAQMEMGGEVGKKRLENLKKRLEQEENMPFYNKDKQPVEIRESISGYFWNDLNKREIIDFRLDEARYMDEVDESYAEIFTEGIMFTENELIKKILEESTFYTKNNAVVISKTREKEETKLDLSDYRRLAGYKGR